MSEAAKIRQQMALNDDKIREAMKSGDAEAEIAARMMREELSTQLDAALDA